MAMAPSLDLPDALESASEFNLPAGTTAISIPIGSTILRLRTLPSEKLSAAVI
jgi:hypothetical protein